MALFVLQYQKYSILYESDVKTEQIVAASAVQFMLVSSQSPFFCDFVASVIWNVCYVVRVVGKLGQNKPWHTGHYVSYIDNKKKLIITNFCWVKVQLFIFTYLLLLKRSVASLSKFLWACCVLTSKLAHKLIQTLFKNIES